MLSLLLFGCDAGLAPPESGSLFVTAVTPPLGPRSGAIPVTLHGRGFTPQSAVYFDDVAATQVEVTSENELHLTLPAYAGALGPVALTVLTPDDRRVIESDQFTYYALDFAADPHRSPSNDPHALAAMDLNRDGAADLIIARQNPPGVSVLLSGGLDSPSIIEQTLGSQPSALTVADISGDGLPDLLVADGAHSEVWLLLARSDGTLTAGAPVWIGCTVNSLQSADLDGDGRADLVVGCLEKDQSAYFLRNQYGPGGIAPFSSPQPLAAGPGPLALTLADFDGDGRRDIATVSAKTSQRQILLNQGGARFAISAAQDIGRSPTAVLALDVNRDGRLDLLTADSGGTSLGIALGDGSGHFTTAPAIELGHAPGALSTIDWNGDRLTDLAVGDPAAATVQILIADGAGGFRPAAALSADGPNASLLAFFTDGGQTPALATAVRDSSRLRVFRPDPTTTLESSFVEQSYATIPAPHAFGQRSHQRWPRRCQLP